MPAGRPSKYNEELLEKAKDYVVNFKDTYGDEIPTIAGLACELDVCRDTVHAWAKDEDKAEFSDTVKKMMGRQERTLINDGLSNKSNALLTKLLLSNHGHTEKQEVDMSSSDGSMTPPAVTYKIADD